MVEAMELSEKILELVVIWGLVLAILACLAYWGLVLLSKGRHIIREFKGPVTKIMLEKGEFEKIGEIIRKSEEVEKCSQKPEK